MTSRTMNRTKAALAAFVLLVGLGAPRTSAADMTVLELTHGQEALLDRLAAGGQKPRWITDPTTGLQCLEWQMAAGIGRVDLTGLVRELTQQEWSRVLRLDATVRVDTGNPVESEKPVRLRLWARGNRYFHFEAEAAVRANRSDHLGFDLTTLPTRIGLGPVEELRLDLLDIPTGPYRIRLEEFRLAGADPNGATSRAIVDRYGQFIPKHWPEKIAFNSDLARHRAWEEAWLKAHPSPEKRDRFGGDTAAPRGKASGFFRLEQDGKGRWWFITPDGHRLFSYGLDAASLWQYTDPTGRELLYEWLPKPGGEFKDAIAGTELRLYSANLQRKYGRNWQQTWTTRSLERFKAWGMNTLGAWADGSLTTAQQMPYTFCFQFQWQKEWTALPRVTELIPDPFDPAFEAYLRATLPSYVSPMKDDPWLIGYFVANELAWYQLDDQRLLDLPASSAAKRALRDGLSRQYATPAAWGNAWGLEATDWSAVGRLTGSTPITPTMQADLRRFRGELADRFFEVYCRVLRELDPNHLILGARFLHHPEAHQAPDEVYEAAGRYCDAISENAYSLSASPAYYARRYQLAKKPILVSEFHWGVTDTPRQLGWGVRWVASREARAALLTDYVKALARMPQVVGAHYFQYTDQPLLGRHDGENAQIGFVDTADTPYEELIEASREIGEQMYRWRDSIRAEE